MKLFDWLGWQDVLALRAVLQSLNSFFVKLIVEQVSNLQTTNKKRKQPNGHFLFMAGVAGFEPAHDEIKTRCLTAWRHPNIVQKHYLMVREGEVNIKE